MSEKRIGITSQLLPPKPIWSVEMVPDQKGKTVIITGGDRGIGKDIARVLLSKGSKVYIATQSAEMAKATIDRLKRETGKESIFFLKLDLADLESVKAAAEEYISKESKLHTLYNNEGINYAPIEKVTTQGYDIHFGTSVLGHFYFTKLLIPTLIATAKKSPGAVRVVNVSSIVHMMAPSEGIRWPTIDKGDEALAARRQFNMARLKGQTSLGSILFSNELARRYGSEGIVSISLFPGAVNADISGHAGSFFGKFGHTLKSMAKIAICLILLEGDIDGFTGDDIDMDDVMDPDGDSEEYSKDDRGDPERSERRTRSKRRTRTSARHRVSGGSNVSLRALNPLYAGTAPDASKLNGKYLTAWTRVSLPHKKALNQELGAKLWDWCEEHINDVKTKAEL